jgi:hypothetical protein
VQYPGDFANFVGYFEPAELHSARANAIEQKYSVPPGVFGRISTTF